jgi:hypothetical protein
MRWSRRSSCGGEACESVRTRMRSHRHHHHQHQMRSCWWTAMVRKALSPIHASVQCSFGVLPEDHTKALNPEWTALSLAQS